MLQYCELAKAGLYYCRIINLINQRSLTKTITKIKFSTMDILVPITMKNAAKCDKQCELQNRESSDFWTQLASTGSPVGMLVSVSCNLLTQILMREIPFSCQVRKHSELCTRLRFGEVRTQCSSHIAYNVNSLRVESAQLVCKCLDL